MYKFQDRELAEMLDEEINSFGVTENATLSKLGRARNYKPRTIIDQTLELIDPTPNIHTLFVQFNEKFFWNVLLPVEVKWSNRMTSSAGICSYHPRNKQCVITLSAPLLKLRPRKDLVETLLHEMIHGYLFLTNNNRDRDGHGPEFCKHMHRINNEAGTKITIFHNFHDEVNVYKQHWWRCEGPCQKRAPYFGTVRRAINRAPGPSDWWWNQHQQNCGGQFIKIKAPEKVNTKNIKANNETKLSTKNNNNGGKILSWLIQKDNTLIESSSKIDSTTQTYIAGSGAIKNSGSTLNGHVSHNNKDIKEKSETDKSALYKTIRSTEMKKFGSSINTVHSPAPLHCDNFAKQCFNNASNVPKFTCSGLLGGNAKKSNLIEKYSSKSSSKHNSDLVNCPTCDIFIDKRDINKHLDICLQKNHKVENAFIEGNQLITKPSNTKTQKSGNTQIVEERQIATDMLSAKKARVDEFIQVKHSYCPNCNKEVETDKINAHLDDCLIQSSSKSYRTHPLNSKYNEKNASTCHKCLVCNSTIPPDISVNEHLEDCIGRVFNDSSDIFAASKDEDINTIKYPCPVCMELQCYEYMNEHLDNCVLGQ